MLFGPGGERMLDHDVPSDLCPELSIMSWVVSDLHSHKVGCVQQHSIDGMTSSGIKSQ